MNAPNAASAPRAVLADDERLMREQLRARLVDVWPELEIVAEARNGQEAVDLVAQHRPDVVFLDIRMPGLTGVEAARQIAQLDIGADEILPEVVFITAYDQYAVEAFERFRADAVTINPYMGRDSVEPWLAYPDKGVILLCRTSNPGGSDLQFLDVGGGEKLFERVARLVASEWNTTGQCALVVGATFPQEIARVRELVGEVPLLVPGIGAQGGDIEATVRAGRTASGGGLMINSSRAILYAGKGEDFAGEARRVALATREAINLHR